MLFSDSEDVLNEVVEETPLLIDLPKLPEDPFLSPYLANDDLFKHLPPVHIVVCYHKNKLFKYVILWNLNCILNLYTIFFFLLKVKLKIIFTLPTL